MNFRTASLLRDFFDLSKLQDHPPCIASENRNQHAEASFIMEHFSDSSNKVDENTIDNLDTIADFKFMLLRDFLLFIFQILKISSTSASVKGSRLFATQKVDHTSRIFHILPGIIGQIHFDKQISRPKPLFNNMLLPLFHF